MSKNIVDSILDNQELGFSLHRLVRDLMRELLPYRTISGVYVARFYTLESWACKYEVTRKTLLKYLDMLINAGVIERFYDVRTNGSVQVLLRAMPLLAHAERILLTPSKIYSLDSTYNKTKDCFTIKDFLLKHIGADKRIVLRSWLPEHSGTAVLSKYFQPRSATKVDIEQYVLGDKFHLYGSRPLLKDGTAYVITFDVDAPYDEPMSLDASSNDIQQSLALANFKSLYFPRRPGRGHISVVFAQPIDAEMAYSALVRAAPMLASCEAFPVGDLKHKAVSWPLWHLDDYNNVCESPIILFTPARPGIPLVSKGIRSEREKTEGIFETAINDASLVKDVPQVVNVAPVRYSTPTSQAPREAFNASHTVSDVLGMRVGKRFHSPWRFPKERTASCVVYKDHIWDYGGKGQEGKQWYDAYDCAQAMKGGLL